MAIRKMMTEGDYTLAEVGQKFNITRERIRQIANSQGLEPGVRRQQITIRKVVEKRVLPPKIKSIEEACKARGFEFRCPSGRIVIVNGFKCAVRSMSERKYPIKGKKLFTIHQFRELQRCEFVIYSSSVGFFIFRKEDMGAGETCFVWKANKRFGVIGFKHDYDAGWENWNLLKGTNAEAH